MNMSKSENNKLERQVYTVEEIRQILGIGRTATYALMHNPPFRVLKVGGRIVIPKASFERWLFGV